MNQRVLKQTHKRQSPRLAERKIKKNKKKSNVVANPTKKRRLISTGENEEANHSTPSTSQAQLIEVVETTNSQSVRKTKKKFRFRQPTSEPPPPAQSQVASSEPSSSQQPQKNKKRKEQQFKPSALNVLVSTICDLLKVSPETKNLVLTLLVPIIVQIWPSISTLNMSALNTGCHG
jgi:hypothetical protein